MATAAPMSIFMDALGVVLGERVGDELEPGFLVNRRPQQRARVVAGEGGAATV
jgi:hypothetical protein